MIPLDWNESNSCKCGNSVTLCETWNAKLSSWFTGRTLDKSLEPEYTTDANQPTVSRHCKTPFINDNLTIIYWITGWISTAQTHIRILPYTYSGRINKNTLGPTRCAFKRKTKPLQPIVNVELLLMVVLYISRGKAIMFYLCTLFFFFFFQTLISEVTERILFILSHNIRSWCNLIMHSQKLVNLYPTQTNCPKTSKNWHSGDRVRH